VKKINRRDFVRAAGAVTGCGISGAVLAQGPDGHTAITRPEDDKLFLEGFGGKLTCIRTPETVDGPYYYESSMQRRSIAEDHRGVRLRLGITVANAHFEGSTCTPLGGAIVDVWHADAGGQYSNVGADLQARETIGQTFLRGHQVTDEHGYVEFDPIVPGWELVGVPAPAHVILRTTHIHVKVFSDHKVATTQLYFPDDYLNELYSGVQPYAANRSLRVPGTDQRYDRIPNSQDMEFLTDKSRPMSLAREKDGLFAKATIGVVTLGTRRLNSLFR
jgi:protocatechuate 3,4-dioxygenase beta subunit